MLSVHEHRYSRARLSRHAHAETTVTMVLAGTLRERVGTRDEIGRPLSIVVKPRGTEHANDFGDDVRTLQIVMTGACAADPELSEQEFGVWRWTHAGRAVPAFLRLLRARRLYDAGEVRADVVESFAYEALASAAPELENTAGDDPPRWLILVRQSIDDEHLTSVRQLAEQAGVHPVYLARQFRRWYGQSITQYRGRRRLQDAASAITGSGHALSFIAHETGFADHSHMCRVFGGATGVTPAAYRRLTRG